MASVDLGKAHVKVVLSDEIPGVARDLSKLRQSGAFRSHPVTPRCDKLDLTAGVHDVFSLGTFRLRPAIFNAA